MSAPSASEIRSPFIASREIKACSAEAPARRPPAALRLRCGPAPPRETRSPAGPAHVRGGRVLEKVFFNGVTVEPGDGAQPVGDRYDRDRTPGPPNTVQEVVAVRGAPRRNMCAAATIISIADVAHATVFEYDAGGRPGRGCVDPL
jgi:hypothetical protein